MNYPFLSAMIVFKNEEKYIEQCLMSLVNQTYPADRYEILLIDGMSTDSTRKIVKDLITNKNIQVDIKCIINEKQILASGWNLGIKAAQGDYVTRIDAHAYADREFLERSVETILSIDDAVCVGGAMKTEALTKKGQIIANVLSSPFGVGNSKFRYSEKAEYVDTVAFGLYKKSVFEQVGCFDETLKRNQDNDMHRRIRDNGGKFYLNPNIKTVYHPREDVVSMMKQAYNNGKWNFITYKIDKDSLSLRHMIPLVFVCGITFLGIGGIYFRILWFLLALISTIYLILAIIFSFEKTKKIKEILLMPLLFLLLHGSYGIGSLLSLLNISKK